MLDFNLVKLNFATAVAILLVPHEAISAPVFADLDPSGTYLFVHDTNPGFDQRRAPTTVPLAGLNFSTKIPRSNQYLAINTRGTYTGGGGFTGLTSGVARFSNGGSTIPSPSGATEIFTIPSSPFGIPSDVGGDFFVPDRGSDPSVENYTIVQVPDAATSLQFTVNDSFFRDNTSQGYRAKVTTFQDVMDGSLTIDDRSTPGVMFANILPMNRFSIDDAARLGGYDHFNWLQNITSFEFEGETRTVFDPFPLGVLSRGTGLDPLLGGNAGQFADNSPLYWNETNSILFPDSLFIDFDAGDGSPNNSSFRDGPNLIFEGWSALFNTSLVGVRDDGTFDVLSDILDNGDQYTFNWKYTQTSNSLLSILPSGPDGRVTSLANADLSLAGGGQIDFLGFGQIDSPAPIPVPAALPMFLTALLGLGYLTRTRCRSHSV